MISFGPIRNLKKVQDYIKSVPHGAKKEAVEAVTEYIIGDESHGLSHDDPYKQTTRKAVYGQTFESDAQRRYVMAAIKDGTIKIGKRNPDPTKAGQAYTAKYTNNGYNATIQNKQEGAYWTRIWGGWKNWRSYDKVIRDNIKGAMKHATARVNALLKAKAKKK